MTRASERIDQQRAGEALKKALRGEKLSAREQAALKRYEKDREEKLRWEHYESIPQKHWREMSGRQTKIIKEQAALYGIPFGGPKVNLPAVVKALHNFLAANAKKLAADDDALLGAKVSSPALERFREERAKLARLERMERERLLVSRDAVREGLGRVAAVLRSAGETLQKQFGPAALEVLHEALDDAEEQVRRLFGEADERSEQ